MNRNRIDRLPLEAKKVCLVGELCLECAESVYRSVGGFAICDECGDRKHEWMSGSSYRERFRVAEELMKRKRLRKLREIGDVEGASDY